MGNAYRYRGAGNDEDHNEIALLTSTKVACPKLGGSQVKMIKQEAVKGTDKIRCYYDPGELSRDCSAVDEWHKRRSRCPWIHKRPLSSCSYLGILSLCSVYYFMSWRNGTRHYQFVLNYVSITSQMFSHSYYQCWQ